MTNDMRRIRTWLLKCRECGRTERTHSLEMLAWTEAECCAALVEGWHRWTGPGMNLDIRYGRNAERHWNHMSA